MSEHGTTPGMEVDYMMYGTQTITETTVNINNLHNKIVLYIYGDNIQTYMSKYGCNIGLEQKKNFL